MDHRSEDRSPAQAVILLVDDEQLVRNFIGELLTYEGYEVLSAVNGQQALELSRSFAGSIDLLLTDIVMPKMDGLELASCIRRERPAVKILLMSGKSSGEIRIAGKQIEFLPKPFVAEALRAKLLAMLA